MIKSVCILSDLHDWHSEELSDNFRRCNVSVKKLKFDQISTIILKNQLSFFYDYKLFNFEAIWVRFINSGSIEEITEKLSILHLMKRNGVYVHNTADVIEKTVDKFMCSALSSMNNIETPKTYVFKNFKMLSQFLGKGLLSIPYLIKPLFGSQGKGIKLIRRIRDLEIKKDSKNIFYLQEFLGKTNQKFYSDIRVMVSNHKVVYAIERISSSYITNAYQGASLKQIEISSELIKLSHRVSKIFKLAYGGLDFKYHNKKYYLLEVNSIPSWKKSSSIFKKSITKVLVDDFLFNAKKFKNNE